jgi:hypothetical protein
MPKIAAEGDFWHAQGIEAEIPEQTAERFVRNWSG